MRDITYGTQAVVDSTKKFEYIYSIDLRKLDR